MEHSEMSYKTAKGTQRNVLQDGKKEHSEMSYKTAKGTQRNVLQDGKKEHITIECQDVT
ncbi:hypothetical protein BgiMline_010580, partial [Biomphalaria glabrata]